MKRALLALSLIGLKEAFTFDKLLPFRPGNWFKSPELALKLWPDTKIQAVNGYQAMQKKALENIELVPLEEDSGWQRFAFGNTSTDAIPEYDFNLTDLGYVWITDAYCRGDSFYVFNNDQLIGETEDTIDDGCQTNATDPSDAVQDGTFGHVYFNLTPGQYRFRMMVKDSPFLAGKAFIRLDSIFKTPGEKPPTTSTETTSATPTTETMASTTIDNGGTLTTSTTASITTSMSDSSSDGYSADSSLDDLLTPDTENFDRFRCRITRDRLYVFNIALQPEMARYVCEKFKMELATIDNGSLVDSLKLAWDCGAGKEGERFWIQGYEPGKTLIRRWRPGGPPSYQYQLMTGAEFGRGSIVRAKDYRESLPFICQRPPHRHPEL